MGNKARRHRIGLSAGARNLHVKQHFKYKLVGGGILIGLLTGLVIGGFRLLLSYADVQRNKLVDIARAGGAGAVVVFAVLIALAVIISLLLRFEPQISGSGIPQVEGELRGQVDQNWLRTLLGKLAGCALAIGGGLALGREGPSIQIGAMLGKGLARGTGRLLTEERMLMTAGAGAGLAAAFGAPLAGAIFSLEELHKNFSAEVLISTLAATVVSDFTAANIVGVTPVFNLDVENRLPLKFYWSVILLGVLIGVFGAFYNKMIDIMQNLFTGLRKPEFRMIFIISVSYVLMFFCPDVLGSGNSMVTDIVGGDIAIGVLAALLIVKFFFSTASFGSGSPGGIFLPLLVLGALAGGLYCKALGMIAGIDQQYMTSYVLIAMTGYFAAIVRAPVTGIILLTEMTGNFYSLLAMSVTSLVAYVTSDLLNAEPIYDQLLKKRLGKASSGDNITRTDAEKGGEPNRKIIIDSEVYIGSYMDGKTLDKIELPHGSLVLTIFRDGEEIIPGGGTVIKGGDELEILCRNADIAATDMRLEARCRTIL